MGTEKIAHCTIYSDLDLFKSKHVNLTKLKRALIIKDDLL